MYQGDIRLGDTLDFKFTTRRFSTGAPFTLASSPVLSAYVGNSTTELTAGITLTVDFDSRTGLNHVRIVATSGNGYATASNYDIVITTGTVDSVSVVGEVVGSFSIEARSALMPTASARTLDVTATGAAGIDWANLENPTNANNLSGTSTKALEPTVAARTLDVSAGGEAGIDWNNVGTPSATLGLSGTTIKAITDNVNAKLANSVTHGGNAALLELGSSTATPALLIQNSGGDAIRSTSSGGNGHGIKSSGNGSGDGIRGTGGATGCGLNGVGGATSGHGVQGIGGGSGNGIFGEGTPILGDGIAGHGNQGISATARTGSNGNGFESIGDGTGHGIAGEGGATGIGISGLGGATSGDGIRGTGVDTRYGIVGFSGANGGAGISGQGIGGNGISSESNADGVEALYIAANVGNADALATYKSGTGKDIRGNIEGSLSGSVGSIDVGGIDSLSFNAGAIDAAALDITAGQEIADRLLARSLAGGADGPRTVTDALRPNRNKVEIDTFGAMTVYEEDDSTPAWTAIATRDALADPITSVDPT